MRFTVKICLTFLLTDYAVGEATDTVEDDFGILNPPDTGRNMLPRKLEMGVIDSVTCSLGINNTREVLNGFRRLQRNFPSPPIQRSTLS